MDRTLYGLVRLLRYRFLSVGGLLPYVLGAAVAFHQKGLFNLSVFLVGAAGIGFALLGVEAFNEFFDWQIGTDRVFQLERRPETIRTLLMGVVLFLCAFAAAVYLAFKTGMPVLAFSFAGFLAALFYLAPPVKLAYRGLGEFTIALAYGPLMTLGAYYLQTRRLDFVPLLVSVIPALLLFVICVINEVPDFFSDRIVGKRNICVRIGRRNSVRLCGVVLLILYSLIVTGLVSGILPWPGWLALVCLPVSLMFYTTGIRTCETPRTFVVAIRSMIVQYLLLLAILTSAYVIP